MAKNLKIMVNQCKFREKDTPLWVPFKKRGTIIFLKGKMRGGLPRRVSSGVIYIIDSMKGKLYFTSILKIWCKNIECRRSSVIQDTESFERNLRTKIMDNFHFETFFGHKLYIFADTVIPRFTGPRFTVSLDITCLFVFPRYRVLQ